MTCDYCDEGNVAIDGWHVYVDSEDETSFRVPCAIRYRDDPHRRQDFTKHPATWLNGDCWLDDTGTTAAPIPEPDYHVAAEGPAAPEEGWAEAVAQTPWRKESA